MKQAVFLAGLFAVCTGWTAAMQKERSRTVDQTALAEISRIERAVGEAIARKDRVRLEQWFDPRFYAGDPTGQLMTRDDALDRIAAPGSEVDSLVNEPIEIRLFGDTAVVFARGTAKGRFNGQPVEARFQYLRVWQRRGGQWRAIAAQSTMLPQAPAGEATADKQG
jgi:hypothetical protein